MSVSDRPDTDTTAPQSPDEQCVLDTLHTCREWMLPQAESPAETETWVAMFDQAEAALKRLAKRPRPSLTAPSSAGRGVEGQP